MASIHRHSSGRSPYWFASFQKPDGSFTLRSTKQTDRHKALKVALEFETAAKKSRAGDLTEAQCRKVLSDLLETTTGDTVKQITTRKFLLGWMNDVDIANSEGTAERYRGTVEKFLVYLTTKADRSLSAISHHDIKGFMADRRKAGLAEASVTLDAKTIGVAFNDAKRQGLVLQNPVALVKFAERTKSSKRRNFTSEQVKLLVAEAKGDWKTVILFSYYTTMRLSDAVNVRVKDIDLVERTVVFQPKKTGEPLIVPLHDALEAHLLSVLNADKPQEFVCPTLAGKRTRGAHGLSAGFKAIMKAAGIDDLMGAGSGKRKFSALSFHSLRHTSNTALAQKNVSQEMRMKVTGHKSTAMNTRYTHFELENMREAVNKLTDVT
jgi:integrase